jgi:hypothetical protein
MKSPEIRMYNALKPSLGEEDAQVFVEACNESVASKIEIMKSDLATKGDLHNLRNELKEDMHALRNEFKADMNSLKLDLKEVILSFRDHNHKLHVECLKTIYFTGLIQLIIIIGSVLAIIRASI